MKIFGIEMEPLQNSAAYENLVETENVLEKSRLTDTRKSVLKSHKLSINVPQRDMYKYRIHKYNQAKFYFALNFAPKRLNLPFSGEFELVKIKSNGDDLIRIFIADEQVKIHFHSLYHSRNQSAMILIE